MKETLPPDAAAALRCQPFGSDRMIVSAECQAKLKRGCARPSRSRGRSLRLNGSGNCPAV